MTKFLSVLFRGRDLRDSVQKCRGLQARGVSLYKASCKYIQYLEKPSLTYGRHTLCFVLFKEIDYVEKAGILEQCISIPKKL